MNKLWKSLTFGALLASLGVARPAAAKDLFVVPVHVEPVQLDGNWPVTQFASARFAFGVPSDMSTFQSARVVFLPTSTGSGTYNLFLHVKRGGEIVSPADIVSAVNLPVSFVANEMAEVAVGPIFAGVFDATSAGTDQVSFTIQASGALLGSARILGMRFVYAEKPLVTNQLSNSSVNSTKIADNTITSADVANESLTGADIANGGIATLDLANASITADKVVNGTITGSKIASATLNGVHVADESLTGADIANGGIGTGDLANGSITGDKILNGTITGNKISSVTLSAVHLIDEAGVEFAGGAQSVILPPVPATVRSINVSAPVPGFVIVSATGAFQLSSNFADGRCGLRSDAVLTMPSDPVQALVTLAGITVSPFAVTKGFAVTGGTTTTFRLVCMSGNPAVPVRVLNTQLTAVFTPTRY